MDAITRECRTTYRAAHHSGTRDTKKIDWIVMHSTEGGTAESVARYFSTPESGGSAHLVVDDQTCFRCLPNNVIAWGAPGANVNGFHIEQCGFAAWTAEEWAKHETMLHRAAYKAAIHAHLFNIPVRTFVTAEGLKAGHRGITTHAEVSRAFPNDAGNHHDPGLNWPRYHFMNLVRQYIAAV